MSFLEKIRLGKALKATGVKDKEYSKYDCSQFTTKNLCDLDELCEWDINDKKCNNKKKTFGSIEKSTNCSDADENSCGTGKYNFCVWDKDGKACKLTSSQRKDCLKATKDNCGKDDYLHCKWSDTDLNPYILDADGKATTKGVCNYKTADVSAEYYKKYALPKLSDLLKKKPTSTRTGTGCAIHKTAVECRASDNCRMASKYSMARKKYSKSRCVSRKSIARSPHMYKSSGYRWSLRRVQRPKRVCKYVSPRKSKGKGKGKSRGRGKSRSKGKGRGSRK
jgi:hypothetical protein